MNEIVKFYIHGYCVVVADRQKHHSMSWSVAGSTALASLTALVTNGEVAHWLKDGILEFKLVA